MKLSAVAALAATGMTLSACATVIEGTTQSVSVTTTPVEGAQCTLVNSQGTWYATTPGSVVVHKTKTNLDITCNKDGYQPGHITAISHFGATTAANLAGGVGGVVIGGVVDAASGANYSYDNPIIVALGRPLAAGETASSLPVQLHCLNPNVDGVFASDGIGSVNARIRFDINSATEPGALSVTPAADAICTLSGAPDVVLANVSFGIDGASSWTAGGKAPRDIEKHVDIVEIPPDSAKPGDKTYSFRIKAKDTTEGKITLDFPVRYR